MVKDTVEVEQRVSEEVKGVMIGADVYRVEGGRLTVNQTAKVVSGEMHGLKIGTLGGGRAQPAKEDQVIKELEERLRLEVYPAAKEVKGGLVGVEKPLPSQPVETSFQPICSKCNKQLDSDAKFCSSCGTPVVIELKFCPQCGAKISPGANFCERCGRRSR